MAGTVRRHLALGAIQGGGNGLAGRERVAGSRLMGAD
jgi:hypothetical protein